jgi:hypothetical protein
MDMKVMVSGAVPLLDTFITCEALPPTDTFPKLTALGAKEIAACPPEPVSGTLVGDFGSLLVMETEPEFAPVAGGAYLTVTIWL